MAWTNIVMINYVNHFGLSYIDKKYPGKGGNTSKYRIFIQFDIQRNCHLIFLPKDVWAASMKLCHKKNSLR